MSDHLSDTFRANVRAAIRSKHMRQSQLACRMGVTGDSVSKLLNNPRGIGVTLETVARYADALGIDPAVLLTPGGVQRSRVVKMENVA